MQVRIPVSPSASSRLATRRAFHVHNLNAPAEGRAQGTAERNGSGVAVSRESLPSAGSANLCAVRVQAEKLRWGMLTVMKRILRLIICFGLAVRVMSDAGIHSGGRGSGVSRGNTIRRVVGPRI